MQGPVGILIEVDWDCVFKFNFKLVATLHWAYTKAARLQAANACHAEVWFVHVSVLWKTDMKAILEPWAHAYPTHTFFGLAAPVWVLKSKNPLQIDCFMATNLFFRIQMIVSRLFNHENTQNKRIRGWYGTSNQRSNIQLCHSNPGWAALNLIKHLQIWWSSYQTIPWFDRNFTTNWFQIS